MAGRHFIISRLDKIGDVILVLPMAAILKRTFPGCKVSLLGHRYTAALGTCSVHIDATYAWDEIAKLPSGRDQIARFEELDADAIIHVYPKAEVAKLAREARIPLRVGTSRRMYHWLTCNRFVYVQRQGSPLHEAQLNIRLLRGVGVKKFYALDEISTYFGFTKVPLLPAHLVPCIDRGRFNLIVHPMTGGSAREWPIGHFARLIENLPREQFNVLVTGSEPEGEFLRDHLPLKLPHVADLIGALSLEQLVALINRADGLLAASTGPVHIAAALGKPTFGIYVPYRSRHAGRWGPIGPRVRVFQLANECKSCPGPNDCECMRRITPAEIASDLLELARVQRDGQSTVNSTRATSALASSRPV